MRTLVVVPTYNEVGNIELYLRAARANLPEADILVVDDNSPDGTADLAEQLAAELGHVKVLRRPRKDGLGNAYRAGMRQGIDEGYEILVQNDADLSHDPAMLPRLVEQVEQGADLVVGSRYVPGGSTVDWPTHRKVLSRYGNRYAAWVLELPIHDVTSGFRAYRASVLEAVHFDATRANGYAFLTELTLAVSQWGGTIVELPITFRDRTEGTSKMSSRIIVESMARVTGWGLDRRWRRLRGKPPRPAHARR